MEENKDIKNNLLSLHHHSIKLEILETDLSSIHYVLSKSTDSLAGEHEEGIDKYAVKELFWKINVAKSLLFKLLIELRKDNNEIENHVINLFDNLVSDEEW